MNRATRGLALLVAFVGAGALVPAAAEAHGLVQRQQLPIPQWLFAWAAAAVLVISFFALAGVREPADGDPVRRDRRLPAGRDDPGRLYGQRDGAGQLGADVSADHVL